MSGMNQEKVNGRSGRIGVEIGGTFTDLVWIDRDGVLRTGKTSSTPQAIHEAVLRVIDDAGLALDEIEQVAHGSTVATNALIMRRGAKAALVTTAGFRDALIIGRAERDHDIYSMQYRHPEAPVRRGMIRELEERILHDGTVLKPLDREAAWRTILPLIEDGVDGIAVCLLHSYRNPAHEKMIIELLRERAPHVAVSASHEVSPEFREYERSVTTTVNAFVGPVVSHYTHKLSEELSKRGYLGVLQIMQSNGGMMPASAAGSNAVRMLLSGPAAGIRAAMWFARRNGIHDVITLDMGGTSTDVGIAPGLTPAMVPELKIDGLPVQTASVDMATIGAGGGSIATIDRGGFLAVGPESAGALPGPACYDRGGTRATVTDAQVIAGLLRPARFFGGRMILREDLARQALGGLNFPGGVRQAADAVLRMVNSNMASAVRLVSARRGIDPSSYTIVAYGGGGPLHGATVAEELGIRQVLVPWAPGLSSAFGLLIADTIIDTAQSDIHRLGESSLAADRLRVLRARAAEIAAKNGLRQDSYTVSVGLDMRYAGQAFELTVWTDGHPTSAADLRRLFEDEHRTRYGYARAKLSVEVVSYRMRIVHSNEARIETPLPSGEGPASETVSLTVSGCEVAATLVARETMRPGTHVAGPAIIAETTSTTFVPPEWDAEVLHSGDLMLRRRP